MSDETTTNQTEKKITGGGKTKEKKTTGRLVKALSGQKLSKAEQKGTTMVTELAKTVGDVDTERKRRVSEKASRRIADTRELEILTVDAIKQTDLDDEEYSPKQYQHFLDMYNQTLQDIKEGEIIKGRVLDITRDYVIVDVGFKSEGIIALDEFAEPINIKVGDSIEVYLESVEDQNGQLVLSKQKADFMRVWDRIRESHDAGELVEGRLMRRIKGGIVVDLFGVDAFLPGSQIALRQVPDFDELIGQTLHLKIIKLNKSRRNIVVSRRVVLEHEREKMREQLLSQIEVGQIRKGIVKNITDFGVFIDLGGLDGLLHITDMSWGRIAHPSEVVSLGDQIDVKILDFDKETGRISLGLKQLTEYPWERIEEKFPVGTKVLGTVVSLTDYGAFVELEKGIEGLIHISEMSWTQHIKHPSKIMQVSDKIEAMVLAVDKENEKISLGIKQMEPDPWTILDQRYPIGSKVTGKVRNLTTFGAFIELEEGIDGLVHISDMSWNRRIQHPSEVMKKGLTIDVVVLKIDRSNRRISLGYKQLFDDPWPSYSMKYGIGSECVGAITRVLDRGVIIELGNEVEGFVATHELGIPDLVRPADAFKEGDEIPLKVVEFDQTQRKIVLSVDDYYRGKDRGDLHDFVAKHPTTTGSQKAAAIEQVVVEPEAGFEAAAEGLDIDEEADGQ
ncbi:MAG: 30S ribosomal protein S1 [candidate division Zixibacteria bacterium]|nr:30S ribosomal protein S1 [candidate division Zixibacteria bacterium]